MYKRFFKRFLDILFSLLLIILLFPFFLIISLSVKVKLGSPILFKQKRPGLDEELFYMYKFRTMTNEKNIDGELLDNDKRQTSFGNFLRKTSLDEIPELFNILKGEMSFVGPRPLLINYLPYYSKDERLRHTVRPGLTGLSQVNGRNNLPWDERLFSDVYYVKNTCFFLDFKIIVKTIIQVVKRTDVTDFSDYEMKNLDVERSSYYECK